VLPQVSVAMLVCMGAAAGNFGHNDEVPLGRRIEDYPPFTDPAAKCAPDPLSILVSPEYGSSVIALIQIESVRARCGRRV
jgi:hypothetical protein